MQGWILIQEVRLQSTTDKRITSADTMKAQLGCATVRVHCYFIRTVKKSGTGITRSCRTVIHCWVMHLQRSHHSSLHVQAAAGFFMFSPQMVFIKVILPTDCDILLWICV